MKLNDIRYTRDVGRTTLEWISEGDTSVLGMIVVRESTRVRLNYVGYADAFKFRLKGH